MISAAILALLGLLASARHPAVPPEGAPVPDAAPSGEAVRLYGAGDPEYQALDTVERSSPEAIRRVVVFRHGVPVLDRGLRNEKTAVTRPNEQVPTEEEGTIEDAEVSQDGRFAVVLTTRYRKPIAGTRAETARGRTELTWIDPAHPRGLWSIQLDEGRWAKSVIPLSTQHGIAVSTVGDVDGPADLRLYGFEGTETLRLKESEGSVIDMRATTHGAFLAVDLAYPEHPSLPSRGIAVFDLRQGTRWDYTWSYGSDGEPMSWNLEDTGVLEITTPGGAHSYDRNGKPLRKIRGK